LIASFVKLNAQVQSVRIFTDSKKVDLGEVFDVILEVKHDGKATFELMERDSNLYAFEIAEVKLLPTRQKGNVFLDSAKLKIRTFSIKDSIPVVLKISHGQGVGKQFFSSNIIWVKIKNPMIKGFSNQILPVNNYVHLPVRFDKPLFIFVLIICAILSVIFVVYWLPKIISKYKKDVFIREHEQFLAQISNLKIDSKVSLDAWLALWKKDIQKTLGKNYDSYTISQLKFEFKHLKPYFSELESMLYDKEKGFVSQEVKSNLMQYSKRKFEEKLSQWK
jgi:hypothetical protein